MTTIAIQFEHYALKLSKLPIEDDLEIEIEAKGEFDLRALAGKISVQHAMIDRIAELEAQLATLGDHAAKLAALASYEAPPLETEEDGFITEMALQHGAEMINDDGSTYAFNQEQLLAYTKANRAPSTERVRELEAQLAAVGAGGITAGAPLMGDGGSAEHWKEKAEYWAGEAHRLRGEALRGEPVDGIVNPEQSELAADGELFRRVYQAMVSEDATFAENMDRIAGGRVGDDPPTLEEVRAMLMEALPC